MGLYTLLLTSEAWDYVLHGSQITKFPYSYSRSISINSVIVFTDFQEKCASYLQNLAAIHSQSNFLLQY